MRFVSLNLHNWLVFRGAQTVEFPQNDHANILVIFGENMHGKTSLLNAVRWALYGEALDRQKRIVLNEKLLNIDAAANGETEFSVTLKFVVDGKNYEIFRTATVSPGKTAVSLTLKVDGRVQDGGVSQNIIEGLVPQQISQFLLFDGELLNQFEQLVVDEGGAQATAIKKSIEKALGLPVLQRAHQELDILQKAVSKAFQAEMKKSTNLEILIRNLERHENDLASKREEHNQIDSEIRENQLRISELDEILDRANKDIALSEKKKLLTEEFARNKSDIESLAEQTKDAMGQLWQVPLKSALSPYIEDYRAKIANLSERRRANTGAQTQIDQLEKALAIQECSQCGNVLEGHHLETIKKNLSELKSGLDENNDIDNEIEGLQQVVRGLNLKTSSENITIKIKTLSDSNLRLARRNLKIDDELFEIRNQIADFDEENGRKVKTEYDMRMKELGRLNEQQVQIEKDIEKIEFEITTIRKSKDFNDVGEGSDVALHSKKCDALKEIFADAISGYRDQMRKKVGERASESFGNLTTEHAFDHLEINESYGLNLIIDGKQVSRSAGAEQIVALSLIEALNHLGRRKGPMLMDTPAGRLDRSHRRNVMDYIPTVVTQLAFFAHSGELTDDEIYFDRSRIGKKYKITRIGSFHSELNEI